MKILSIGHITYDITFPIDSYPKENTKNRYLEKEQCVGGPASIAALLLGKWGQNVEIAGIIGDDEYGRKIKKEFALNRVGTTHLNLKEKTETSHSIILANKENGSRTILTYIPPKIQMEKFKPTDAPDIILIDGHEYEASKKILKSYPNAISIIDAGRDKKEVIDLAKKVNYLICSKEFSEKVTGIKIDLNHKKTLISVYKKMEEIFKNTIIITLEAEGCLYKYEEKIKIMPSIKVKTIDSTGAGDIFHGAFIYGLTQKFDLEKNLKFSNIAGALSVTRVGGYKSIPTLEEMNEIYNEVK